MGCHVIDWEEGGADTSRSTEKNYCACTCCDGRSEEEMVEGEEIPRLCHSLIILFICVYSFGRAPVYLSESLRASAAVVFLCFEEERQIVMSTASCIFCLQICSDIDMRMRDCDGRCRKSCLLL